MRCLVGNSLFVLLTRRDVFNGAFVVEHFTRKTINHTGVFGNPDDRVILLVNLGFEIGHTVVTFYQLRKFIAAPGIHIQLLADVIERIDEFSRGVVAVNGSESRIHLKVLAADGGLEYTFIGVFKNAAIAVFCRAECVFMLMTLSDVLDKTMDHLWLAWCMAQCRAAFPYPLYGTIGM